MKEETKRKKSDFLDKNVFFGLTNLNDGFDAKGIRYFSEGDFRVVLQRVKNIGIGIFGIEPWKEGEFYNVTVYDDITDDPSNPEWYVQAFEDFTKEYDELQYAATYHIPAELVA